jgi:hypothetical protein
LAKMLERGERPKTIPTKSDTKSRAARQKRTAHAGMKRAAGRRAPPAPIVVTDKNVEELKKVFDALPKDDPEYDRLGDALHEYMIGYKGRLPIP